MFIQVFNRIFKFLIAKKRSRNLILRSQGEHWDLKEIYHKINLQYFDNALDLHITWYGNKQFVPRARIRLGVYHSLSKVIKIHRVLDQAYVPEYFVSSIVYHEMLHHVLPPVKKKNRKRQIHHAEFIEREKQFKEYLPAKDFSEILKKKLFKIS